MGKMSQKNKILCEVFDCELEDLQLNITLNPTVSRIKAAMDILAEKTAWDLWLFKAKRLSAMFSDHPPLNVKEERGLFNTWYTKNNKKQNEK
jgi:hypothetical protein